MRAFLLNLANDPAARPHLDRALVQGFEAVNDASYDDIRAVLAAVEAQERSLPLTGAARRTEGAARNRSA